MQFTSYVVAACFAILHVHGYSLAQLSEADLDALMDDADMLSLADVSSVGLQCSAAVIGPSSSGSARVIKKQVVTSPKEGTCSAALGGKGCSANSETPLSAATQQAISKHEVEREAALHRIADARAIRMIEANAFTAEKEESDTALGALDRVISVLTKEQQNLEKSDVAAIQEVVHTHTGMIAFDRQKVMSFFPAALLGSWQQVDATKVVAVLRTLREALAKDQEASFANEERAAKAFDDLIAKNELEASRLSKLIADLRLSK